MAFKKGLLVQGLENMEMAKLQLTGHKLIKMSDENGGTVLRDIFEGKENVPSKEPLPEERVVIFFGYSDKELKEDLGRFKTLLNSRPIIAVVTQYSIEWPYEFLLREHLMKDRDENVRLEKERRERVNKDEQSRG